MRTLRAYVITAEADAFAYLIASRTLVPPLAIGLFGPWGSGKSFLMAKVRQRVSQLAALASTGGDASTKEIWTKVVPIEFNAWQYVEADLWAALLSRIFDELSPQAREKLTELSRARRELQRQSDENLNRRILAEEDVANLVEKEKRQAGEATAAIEEEDRVRRQVATIRDVAVRGALDAHARATAAAWMNLVEEASDARH